MTEVSSFSYLFTTLKLRLSFVNAVKLSIAYINYLINLLIASKDAIGGV
ncbi:hypothetical protein Nos7524_0679 [Nostoc sp. PCC 7524]|nr:hypothetical protein Nos7524_0679 [Nostoc sp. PCC 7524]